MTIDRTSLMLGGGMMPLLMLLGSCIPPAEAQSTPAVAPPPRASAPVATFLAPPPPVAVPTIVLDADAVGQGAVLRGRITPADAELTLDGAAVAVADDGFFIIGFDRDATSEARLIATTAAGSAERRIAVTPGTWAIQQIDAPARGAARSDAEFERRRPAEIAQMGAARATVVTSAGWRQRFVWPVTGRISGVFGSQRVYRGVPGSFHNGVDVAVPTGTPYVAPADGVVILAATEPFTLEGYILMIDHGHGLSSVFLHSSRLDVRTGDVVRQGQVLGAVGMTGRATGPHLHWAMRWSGAKVDAQRIAGEMTR